MSLGSHFRQVTCAGHAPGKPLGNIFQKIWATEGRSMDGWMDDRMDGEDLIICVAIWTHYRRRLPLLCACDSQVGFLVVAWCCVVSLTGSMISGVMCSWKWFVAQQKSCRALSLLECPQWSVTSAVGFGAACGDNICVQLLISCLGTITLKVVGYFVRII